MLRLVGALLLMVGAASLGFGAAAQLRARATNLRALMGALEQMERELAFRLTSTPELLEKLSAQAQFPANRLFGHFRDRLDQLGERTLGDLWRETLEGESALLLRAQEKQILYELGEVLGQYDGDGQRKALQNAASGLRQCLERAEGEGARLGRVYGVLGMSAGAALVILLI